MNSFRERLKQIMSEKNMSQSELSRRTGIGRNSISDYLSGKYEAKQDKVYELAKALNVSEAWLMGFDISQTRTLNASNISSIYNKLTPPRQSNVLTYANKQLEEQERKSKSNNVSSIEEYKAKYNNREEMIPFPRYGTTGAGIGEELYDDIIEETVYFDRSEVDEDLLETADFCIYVNGDSMEPAIKRDTYSFVRKTVEIRDGLVALVIYDGTVLIKKIEILEDAINLVSLNPKYETIKVEPHHQFKLIGKIVQ